MRRNTDQKYSEYGHFLRSVWCVYCVFLTILANQSSVFLDDFEKLFAV